VLIHSLNILSFWYGQGRPRWLGPISYDGYPSYLNGKLPGDYGFDIAGLAKDPVELQKYFKYDPSHYGYVMLLLLLLEFFKQDLII